MAEYHELVYKDYIVPQEYKTNDPRGPGWYLDKEIKSKFSKRTSFSYQSDANANIAVGHQGTLIYIAEGQGGNRFYGPQTRGVIRFIHAENPNDIWLRLDVRLVIQALIVHLSLLVDRSIYNVTNALDLHYLLLKTLEKLHQMI